MTEFKWKKEMNAWAEGKRVQIRYFSLHSGKVLPNWQDIEDSHTWLRSGDSSTVEYRIFDLEVEGFYKINFVDEKRKPVVAVYRGGGWFIWIKTNNIRQGVHVESSEIHPVSPEDKVC